MKHAIHITAVRKDPPDLDRFVAALLALAIARVEAAGRVEGDRQDVEAAHEDVEAAETDPEGDHA